MPLTPKQTKKQAAILTRAHETYERGMNSYASYKVSDRTVGEDLVQDSFIKTWAYLVKGGNVTQMKSFLYHVLNHLVIDEYRRHKSSSLDILIEKGFDPSFDDTERIFNISDGKTIMLFIKHLPAKYEKVIRMRYSQDLSIKEISILTEQTRNTVSVQLHRGIEKLQKIYNSR